MRGAAGGQVVLVADGVGLIMAGVSSRVGAWKDSIVKLRRAGRTGGKPVPRRGSLAVSCTAYPWNAKNRGQGHGFSRTA
jgi:hypothetical protein